MLVKNEKLSVEAHKAGVADLVANPSTNTSNVGNIRPAEVGLSQQGQNLNYLYRQALRAAKKNPSPVYIGAEKRLELLADSVNKIAGQSGYEYTPEEISRVVDDVIKDLNIKEVPRGDVNANSGSVYAFLNGSDKAKLADAYQYALDNDTSLDDVRLAAFSLARTRFIEAKIRSGTTWAVHLPNEQSAAAKPDDIEKGSSEKVLPEEVFNRPDSDYMKLLLEQLKNRELFQSNPFLQNPLFQEVTSALLLGDVPSFLKGKISPVGDDAIYAPTNTSV